MSDNKTKAIKKAKKERRSKVKDFKESYNKFDSLRELSRFELKGNIIDQGWFEYLVNEKGKVQPNAVFVLSEIVYWYRPTLIFDEEKGGIKGLKSKFKGDMLQKRYKDIADKFGFTERQVKDACKFLEEKDLIILDFRTIEVKGNKLSNVLYIGLNVDKLKEISILMNDSLSVIEDIKENIEDEDSPNDCNNNDDIPITKKRNRGYYEKTEQPITKKCNTNTENSFTKNNNISINQSEDKIDKIEDDFYNLCYKEIKKAIEGQISYDALYFKYEERAKELLNIIIDILTSNKNFIRVSGENKRADIVKASFKKIGQFECEYVLNQLEKNTTKVNNIYNYLVTALYRSTMTQSNFYKSEVNHDLYGVED